MWFRVDDDLTFHPRVVRAGNAAMGLWVRAGTWCSEHLSDGWIAHDDARALGSAAEIKKLLAVGLWVTDDREEKGYQFHRWATNGVGDKRQPSRAEVEERRRIDRERKASAGRKGAESRWNPSGFRPDSERNPDGIPVESERTPMAPVPSRPVPSPETSDEVSLSAAPESETAAPKKVPKPYPEDFAPSDDHRQYAHRHRLNVTAELAAFRDHALMTGRRGLDWNAGFRNWLKKAAEMQAARPVAKAGSDDWMNGR